MSLLLSVAALPNCLWLRDVKLKTTQNDKCANLRLASQSECNSATKYLSQISLSASQTQDTASFFHFLYRNRGRIIVCIQHCNKDCRGRTNERLKVGERGKALNYAKVDCEYVWSKK